MEKNIQNIEIDNKKLKEMFAVIRVFENDNLKTGKYDDRTMVNQIGKIIQKYAKEE